MILMNEGDLLLQLSSAMAHLEGKECIHGDLRAENVLMTDNKTLKVANFHVTIPSDKTDESMLVS